MNAQLIRHWLLSAYDGDEACLSKHFIAVSASATLPTKRFGVDEANIFTLWPWVGGRYSVTSAVGILPLALHYGYEVMSAFLAGCRAMDVHFRETPLPRNLPVVLGLLGVWNRTFLGHESRALIPYCEALSRLAAHIQQLDMESNGKRVDVHGNTLAEGCSGEVFFLTRFDTSYYDFFLTNVFLTKVFF